MSTDTRTILVFGATGPQGSGVVKVSDPFNGSDLRPSSGAMPPVGTTRSLL